MRKLSILFLAVAVYALMGIGVAAADPKGNEKPNSIVTCFSTSPDYFVGARTAPVFANLDQCSAFSDCSPCIRSLENQGCEVLDLVTEFIPQSFSSLPTRTMFPTATFQLSCERP